MNRNNLTRLFLVCLCFGLPVGLQAAHPFHVSLTEIALNQTSGNFEVSVCLWPSDVERALGLQEKKSIDLDKTTNLDSLLKTYVENRFKVSVGQQFTKIRWVGHETNNKQTWLYFEMVPSDNHKGTMQAIRIENRMFFELNDDQLNQVNFRNGKQSKSFMCRRGDSQFEISR